MKESMGLAWKSEFYNVHGVVFRIKEVVNRFFLATTSNNRHHAKVSDEIRTITKNSLGLLSGQLLMHYRKTSTVEDTEYPILDKKPFCSNNEEFGTLLDFSNFLKRQELVYGSSSRGLTTETRASNKKTSRRRAVLGKMDVSKKSGAARCEDKASTMVEGESKREEEELVSTAASLERSPLKRHSYAIHKRVSVWSESFESGLRYYKFGESGEEILPREEMILRHSFPLDLLEFAIHEDFSRRGEWKSESSIHDHWDALISIDEKKYILEVTVNERGEVYHYYARPRRYIEDNEMIIRSVSEFPDLAASAAQTSPPVVPKRGEIEEDEKGNVSFTDNVSGVCYKILRLSSF
jgi:hypothetical protein